VFDKDHVTEFCGSYNPDKAIFELCDQHQSAT
jgi:hypothetical protein